MATDIRQTSALIRDNTFSGSFGAIYSVAVQYSLNPDFLSPETRYGAFGNPFSVQLTNLLPGTQYHYRAVVSGACGPVAGAARSFVTPPEVPVPVVTTGDAVNVTSGTATIIENSFSGITGDILALGVQYALDPSMASPAAEQGTVASPFSVYLTGLQPETTYYYRAFVTAASESYYGAVKSFTTLQRL